MRNLHLWDNIMASLQPPKGFTSCTMPPVPLQILQTIIPTGYIDICYRLILNSGNYFSTMFKYQNIGNNQGQQGNSFAGPRRHFQKTMALRRKIGEILKKRETSIT